MESYVQENTFPPLRSLRYWSLRVMFMSCGRSDARCVVVGTAHGLLQCSGPVGTALPRGEHVSVVGVKFTVLSA